MYAVINNGGKQYRVQKGDTVRLDFDSELEIGAQKKFEVMAVGSGAEIKVGQPLVSGATVTAEVLAVAKGTKLEIMRRRRRKQFKRHIGFRAIHTQVLITEVNDGGTSDSLGAKEKEEIKKRIGFAQVDVTKPAATADKSAEKIAKAKAKRARKAAATKAAPVKKAAKKATKKKSAKKKTTKKASASKAGAAKKTGTTKKKAAAKKTSK